MKEQDKKDVKAVSNDQTLLLSYRSNSKNAHEQSQNKSQSSFFNSVNESMKKRSRNKFYDTSSYLFHTEKGRESAKMKNVFTKTQSSFDQHFTNEDDDMPHEANQRRFRCIPQTSSSRHDAPQVYYKRRPQNQGLIQVRP